jgi:hypothetical protein
MRRLVLDSIKPTSNLDHVYCRVGMSMPLYSAKDWPILDTGGGILVPSTPISRGATP